MTPDELAKAGTEHAHQKALFAYANCAYTYGFDAADDDRFYNVKTRPNVPTLGVHYMCRLFAIHNQGHGDAIRGGRARAEGVKAGVPDVMLPVSNGFHHGLFIELKKSKKGVISDDQHDWIAYLRNEMYAVAVCYGWHEAAEAIKWYVNYK
jgi:hypothetical protein